MSTPVSFKRDNHHLEGRFHRSDGDRLLPTLILLHGGAGNEEDVLGLGVRLSAGGYNVLTFNFSGTQKSGGLSSFADSQRDIEVAYAYLRENSDVLRIDTERIVLGGWSYGGGMALTYAANHSDVRYVFSVAGTDHGEFMREYASDDAYKQMVDGIFEEMSKPGSPWRLAPGATPAEAHAAGTDVSPYDLRLAAPALAPKHVLLIGGWDDLNVKIDNHILPLYRALRAAGATNVTMRAFQDDHAFAAVRGDLADVILEWMSAAISEHSNDIK